MARADQWPWVRTQIQPEAHHSAKQVAMITRWRLPQVYAAAIHYFFYVYDPSEISDMLEKALSDGPPVPQEDP